MADRPWWATAVMADRMGNAVHANRAARAAMGAAAVAAVPLRPRCRRPLVPQTDSSIRPRVLKRMLRIVVTNI